ncbi:MAG: synthase subunit delta [Patescibacteria group bacterium]|nr:synthase subunit delta [Patescibacteria group bacterium]
MNSRQQAKNIAKLYWNLSQNRSEKEIDQIAATIFDFLASQGQIILLASVIDETKKILYADKNQVAVEVLSKYALTTGEQNSIKSLVHKKTHREAILHHSEAKDLIGGVKIRYEDKILDLSVQKQLVDLKQYLSE